MEASRRLRLVSEADAENRDAIRQVADARWISPPQLEWQEPVKILRPNKTADDDLVFVPDHLRRFTKLTERP